MRAPRFLGLVVGSIALAALLFLFVLPTRTYLAQRHSLTAVQTRLQVFERENAKLTAEADRLQTDAEIERLAREQYGLVKPGEKAFVIVPSPKPVAAGAGGAAGASGAGAASVKKGGHSGLLARVWHDVQFWN
jgi:cell division protein FtsB